MWPICSYSIGPRIEEGEGLILAPTPRFKGDWSTLLGPSGGKRGFCPTMLFRRRLLRRLLRRLTSPRGRKYITSVVKRGDSSPRAEIHRAVEKAISFYDDVMQAVLSFFFSFLLLPSL